MEDLKITMNLIIPVPIGNSQEVTEEITIDFSRLRGSDFFKVLQAAQFSSCKEERAKFHLGAYAAGYAPEDLEVALFAPDILELTEIVYYFLNYGQPFLTQYRQKHQKAKAEQEKQETLN